MQRQIAMLLVVAWAARNAGTETQLRWEARSTKMPGGSGGTQRRSRARVRGGGKRNTDARGKAGKGVGIDSKENGSSGSRRSMQWVVVVGGVSGSEQARA